jgi:hypothetical protein
MTKIELNWTEEQILFYLLISLYYLSKKEQ